ncbi:hypothetical protein Tsubulata_030710 [Turnera subulata]|uniref:Uncharacterized protein n=1 Tax=Turnera subulata TaxID=218843 RepID=A0A9Q0GH11_9ROSI|nr:hypothetical protein Tsubulata_030710 [Turnera subulata]
MTYLIRIQSVEEMHVLLSNLPRALTQIYSEIRQWKEDDCAFNRLCWVLLRALPPCVRHDDFIGAIADGVGCMVDCSKETRNQSRMDVAEILILTTDFGCINRTLSVSIGVMET